jgi:aspartyl-tRNA(Asn)/glutamyl-tRNA(Gln) amidotransferase subunit A
MRTYPELCRLTVTELVAALEAGETTSVEITQAYLSSIAAQNEAVFAYLDVYAQSALQQAAESDERRKAADFCPR